MGTHAAPRPRRRRPRLTGRRLVTAAVLAAVTTSGSVLSATGAWFTDQDAVGSNAFTIGSVDLTASPATAALAVSGLGPGDSGYGLITVTNAGSLPYRYALSQSTTASSLGGTLLLEVKAQTNATSCTAAAYAGNGTVVNGAGATFDTTTVFGSSATGQQTGDRTLANGATEYLCFKVTLPTSAATSTQGASTSGTLTFNAEQTKNN